MSPRVRQLLQINHPRFPKNTFAAPPGANGAGKTTLMRMRMLCAVLESASGEVLLDKKEVTAMGADYRNLLGYLPQ